MATTQASWWWEVLDPSRTGVSGDFAKEFKNEVVKEPGMFQSDHIPDAASLLVREAIQNSWDAARERYRGTETGGGGGQSRSPSNSASPRLRARSATRCAKNSAWMIWPSAFGRSDMKQAQILAENWA